VRLYSRPGNDLTRRFPLIARRWRTCAYVRASSTARRWPVTTRARRHSSVSATASTTRPSSCTPSTSWSSTAKTSGASRSRRARRHWPACYAAATRGAIERTSRTRRRRGRLSPCLRARLRGHRVSKRLGSIYRSGRSKDWLKFKNPSAPAVKRQAEEDWGKERWR
jgi:hypothetical protein